MRVVVCGVFLFQAEDGIRYLVRSRGLGDVYKRQLFENPRQDRPLFFGKPPRDGSRSECGGALQLVQQLSLIHI